MDCPTCGKEFDHIFYLSPYDRGESDVGGMYRRNLGPTWASGDRGGTENRGRMLRIGDWEIGPDTEDLAIGIFVYRACDVDRAIDREERVRLRDERCENGCAVM